MRAMPRRSRVIVTAGAAARVAAARIERLPEPILRVGEVSGCDEEEYRRDARRLCDAWLRLAALLDAGKLVVALGRGGSEGEREEEEDDGDSDSDDSDDQGDDDEDDEFVGGGQENLDDHMEEEVEKLAFEVASFAGREVGGIAVDAAAVLDSGAGATARTTNGPKAAASALLEHCKLSPWRRRYFFAAARLAATETQREETDGSGEAQGKSSSSLSSLHTSDRVRGLSHSSLVAPGWRRFREELRGVCAGKWVVAATLYGDYFAECYLAAGVC